MSNWKRRLLPMSAACALLLAACNTDQAEEEVKEEETTAQEQHEHEHEETSHEQEEMNGTRLLVSYADGFIVMNSAFEEIERYNIGPSSLALGSDMRHVFVKDTANNDSYTLLDIGIWDEDHGDHAHPYEEAPVLASYEIEAKNAAHVVSFNDQTAVFHDDSGLVEVYDAASLSTIEEPIPAYTYQGSAHHGVAVPLSDGTLAVSYQTEEGAKLPGGVKIVDSHGHDVATITDACNGLHGTVYTGADTTEKLAFGCIGNVVAYDVASKQTASIALPHAEARVSTIKQHADSSYYLTNYKEGENPSTKVGVINSETNDFTLVELPAAYGSAFLVAAHNIGYVQAENGMIYKIDLAKAEIVEEIDALQPFNLDEVKVTLALMNNEVLVVVPMANAILQVHGDHVHQVAALDVEPTSVLSVTAY
ncbi:hypothetical protein [Lysinibacillus sp. LZ02]|uniref:hypothetical protein n=1 Tax=Lysinibacillus sp. LZ02 TaxID=3420668 RepID=UPI003D36D958